ncbi:MAG: AtpZ/AtpI family protein [Gemmobacter sp.]
MPDDPDADRLARLEARIAAAKAADRPRSEGMRGVSQGEVAWRMVIELVTGMALGLAIGLGLDTVLGTAPVMIVIFALLGFAAGIRTMLGTARSLNKTMPGDDPADDKRG